APPPEQTNDAHAATAKQDSAAISPQINTPIFLFSIVRGDTPDKSNTIILSRATQSYIVSLELEREFTYQHYRATILTRGRRIWSTSRLQPNELNLLTMTFKSDDLKVGNYQMTLEGLSPEGKAEPIADYRFRVTKRH